MHYNFVRIHQSLRLTPAMAAGVSTTSWYSGGGGRISRSEIQQLLADGIEQDTEVYRLVAPDGRMIVGQCDCWTYHRQRSFHWRAVRMPSCFPSRTVSPATLKAAAVTHCGQRSSSLCAFIKACG